MTDDGLSWVNDPLPDGAQWQPETCPVCKLGELHPTKDGFNEPTSRTTVPVVNGRYLVMPHRTWCPIPFGGDTVNGCPRCAAPIGRIDFSPGYTLEVPHPAGFGTAHLTGTAEEVLGDLHSMLAEGPPERTRSLDEAKLEPCGHVLRGPEAAEAMTRYSRTAREEQQAAAEKQLADDAPLLSAAEDRGYASLVQAYRQAVERRSGTVSGLRTALVLLTEPTGCDDE